MRPSILLNFGKMAFFGGLIPRKKTYFCGKHKSYYNFCGRRSYIMRLKYVFYHIVELLCSKGPTQYMHPNGTPSAWKILNFYCFLPNFKRMLCRLAVHTGVVRATPKRSNIHLHDVSITASNSQKQKSYEFLKILHFGEFSRLPAEISVGQILW